MEFLNYSSNISNVSTNHEDVTDISVTTRVVLIIVLVLTVGICLLGNLITCVIVYRKKPMRSAINLLLTNIACADLLLSLSMLYVLYELLASDVPSFRVCVCFSVVKDTSVSVACYTLLVISVDRYIIIVYRKDRLNPKVAEVIILLIWSGSVGATSPQLLTFIADKYNTADRLLCHDNELSTMTNYKSAYLLLMLSLTFYVPIVVMFYMYAAILRTVQLSSKRIHNHSGSALSVSVTQYSSKLGLPPQATPYRFTGDINAKRKAFGTIMLLFITVFCCWLPFITCRVMDLNAPQHRVTAMFLLTLGFVKSALYPIIFCVRNKKFRATCIRLLPTQVKMPKTCCERKQRRVNPKVLYQYKESESRI